MQKNMPLNFSAQHVGMLRVEHVLYLFVLSIPFDALKVGGIFSIPNLLIGIMALMVLLSYGAGAKIIYSKAINIAILFWAVAFVSHVSSKDPAASARLFVTLSSGMLVAFLIVNICRTELIFRWLINAFFLAAGFASVLAIAQSTIWLLTGEVYYGKRVSGYYNFFGGFYLIKSNALFGKSMILGHYLLLPAITGIIWWMHKKRSSGGWFIKIVTVISVIAILISFSRAAWLSMILFLIIIIYEKIQSLHKTLRPFYLGGLCVGLLLMLVPLADFTLNKMASLSTYNRLGIILSAVSEIKENPVIGKGLGSTVDYAYNDYLYDIARQNIAENPGEGGSSQQLDIDIGKYGRETHNTLLQVAVDLGLIALILYLWFLFTVFREALRLKLDKRNLTHIYIKGITAGFVCSSFGSLFFSGYMLKQSWIVAGLLLAGARVGLAREKHTLDS